MTTKKRNTPKKKSPAKKRTATKKTAATNTASKKATTPVVVIGENDAQALKVIKLLENQNIQPGSIEFLSLGSDVNDSYNELISKKSGQGPIDELIEMDNKLNDLIIERLNPQKEKVISNNGGIPEILLDIAIHCKISVSQAGIMIKMNGENFQFMEIGTGNAPVIKEKQVQMHSFEEIAHGSTLITKQALKSAFQEQYAKDIKNVTFIIRMPGDNLMVKFYKNGQEDVHFGTKKVEDWLKMSV